MKKKNENCNTAAGKLEEERLNAFMESPVTDWIFDEPEAEEKKDGQDRNDNVVISDEYDPANNQNTEIYGPPGMFGFNKLPDSFD